MTILDDKSIAFFEKYLNMKSNKKLIISLFFGPILLLIFDSIFQFFVGENISFHLTVIYQAFFREKDSFRCFHLIFTVWKFQDICIIHILREINFMNSKSAKISVSVILQT